MTELPNLTSVDWTPFVDLVRRHQHFLITTHVRPDGDGLGSQLALAESLRGLGKTVRIVISSDLPPRYAFLNGQGWIERFQPPGDPWRAAEVVLVLDTGTWNQLADFGPFLQTLTCPRAVLDHHQTQDDLKALRFIDTKAEATGRLVYEAIKALGTPLTQTAAEALYVALAMDTGWFRHSNTVAATMELAAALIRAGARPDHLYDQLFEQNRLPRLKLTGVVLERLETMAAGRIAFTEIRHGDYAATGATPPDSEDLINYTRSIKGVEVGLLFMEQPRGGIKISFRSRNQINVAKIAEKFGGGGHKLASGATLNASLQEAKNLVLDAVRAALDEK